jgi:hypothetical protein
MMDAVTAARTDTPSSLVVAASLIEELEVALADWRRGPGPYPAQPDPGALLAAAQAVVDGATPAGSS